MGYIAEEKEGSITDEELGGLTELLEQILRRFLDNRRWRRSLQMDGECKGGAFLL